MIHHNTKPIRSLGDVERFEAEAPIEQRLPGESVYDVLTDAAATYGDRTALTMLMTADPAVEPRRIDYQQLLGLVNRTANLFAGLVEDRPRVAYLLPTLIETHAVLWGAEIAGCAIPLNFLLRPEDLADLVREADANIVVALGPHPQLDIWEKALDVRQQLPQVRLVRIGAPDTPPVAGVIDYGAAIADQPDDRLTFSPPSGDDIAAYFHTGGTTGLPKLAAHRHRGQLVAALGGATMLNLGPSDVLTGTLPMFHVAGTILLGLSTLLAGSELLLLSPAGLRNPEMVTEFWRICERHGVTVAGGVPTSIGAICEIPLDGADIRALRGGVTGAASLPVAVREAFEALTGRRLHEIYGMTEASGLIACDPLEADGGEGSVGYRFPYTDVRLLRLGPGGELGAECDAGEIGVLTVEGPTVSPGYRDPGHDPGTFKDGRLNTGDLAYTDGEGRIHIAGRSKDLIIRSGHNIDPLIIENAMQRHPAVGLAAAVGQPDSYAGERPICYVQLLPGNDVAVEELERFAKSSIAERPAWPKDIHIVDSIPMTAVGKIFKPALREHATERAVRAVLDDLGLAGDVTASSGGPRGMRVVVTVADADADRADDLRQRLSEYLFEADILPGHITAAAE